MRGRKPAKPAEASNVVELPVTGARVNIDEPEWIIPLPDDKLPDGNSWARRSEEIAAEKWRKVVAHMTAARTLGPENATAIEILCVQYARWKLSEAHVALHGPIVAAPRTGVPMHNPHVAVANAAADRVLKIEAELGLPPSTRDRVGKVATARKAQRASDRYIKPAAGKA
ncbi:MAG: P27 family phage terminase small subunit [Rhizobiales bacterium]|nr:P27 family phage terminase small subunit [Hyphomicrobiales bacterium]